MQSHGVVRPAKGKKQVLVGLARKWNGQNRLSGCLVTPQRGSIGHYKVVAVINRLSRTVEQGLSAWIGDAYAAIIGKQLTVWSALWWC